MTGTLIRKELHQHWLAMLLLSIGTMLGYGMIIAALLAKGRAGSGFEMLRLFLILMGPLGGVLLCHRLVVLEYQARSQLFLEGLPVARWRMVAVKYAVGLLALLALAALAYAVACALAWRHEELSSRFLGIVALRSVSVIWFIYSFCFLLGLLGRYRVALYLATFLIVGFLAEQMQLQLAHFGPGELLDNRFAYEGDILPWAALRITWLLGALFMTLTAVLSLIREGSIAALLAEKMSHREKIFVAALLFGLFAAGGLLSDKAKKIPFDLSDAVTERGPGVLVKVAASPGDNGQAARHLARYVAAELKAAREYLGLAQFPPVFVSRRRDLDGRHYERGELEGNDGVQVRANFEATDWSPEHFQVWLLREVLVVSSRERAQLEPKRWVLDGFPLFWTLREHKEAELAADPVAALRALYGTQAGFTAQDLGQWLSFRERVGDDIAAGVAWSGVRTLSRHAGAAACQKFLRRILGIQPPKDLRAALGANVADLDSVLRQETGVPLHTFFAQWQEELSAARRTLAEPLKNLPRIHGEVTCVPLSDVSRKIRYHAVIEPPPANETRYSFLHRSLSAFDEEVDPKSIEHEQNAYPERAQDELAETYSRGARLYWTFALEVPELGCQVISGWHRQEIP